MQKKKTKFKKHKNSAREKEITYLPYEVSWEPITDRKLENLPKNIKEELDDLYKQITRSPGNAISRLQELKREYPKLPLIYNYLSIAYGYVDRKMQNEAILENYQKNPGYLFARCSYAQLCIKKGEYKKIPAVFDNKFDLKALYPRRNRFHITEYVCYSHVMCLYYNAIGDRARAESIYQKLKEKVPDAEEIKEIKKILFPSFFRRLGTRMIAFLEN